MRARRCASTACDSVGNDAQSSSLDVNLFFEVANGGTCLWTRECDADAKNTSEISRRSTQATPRQAPFSTEPIGRVRSGPLPRACDGAVVSGVHSPHSGRRNSGTTLEERRLSCDWRDRAYISDRNFLEPTHGRT